MITPILDNCLNCNKPARKAGGGICLQCEIYALIDLSFERMHAALRGDIPVIGRKLPASRKQAETNQR